MLANQPDVTTASVYSLLLSRLQAAIGSSSEVIPLQKTRESRSLYVSAIALKLAPVWQQPAMEIAAGIATHCQSVGGGSGPSMSLSPQNLGDFTVEVVSPGMILFELTDAGVAAWLQRLAVENHLSERGIPVINQPLSLVSDRLFPIQYSHARCCSILSLAHRDRLITLARPPFWQLSTPNPLPWLNLGGQLRLRHPAESSLISQLLATLDAIAPSPSFQGSCERPSKPINWLNLAHDLSQAFQEFYRQCRIWGEVKAQQPELAQARLGLVLATQPLLRSLLQDCLGVVAPLEL